MMNLSVGNEMDLKKFSETINLICFSVGIKSALSKPECEIIFDFCINHFRTLSIEEMKEAFSLWSAKKLEFKDSHFQSMDNNCVGNVLNSYIKYKSVKLKESLKVTEAKTLDADPEETRKSFIENCIVQTITKIKEKKQVSEYSYVAVYDFLTENEYLKPTKEERWTAISKAQMLLLSKKKSEVGTTSGERRANRIVIEELENKVLEESKTGLGTDEINEGKRVLVREFFDNFILAGLDERNYFK